MGVTRSVVAYVLVVIAVAFGFWRQQTTIDHLCRSDRLRWTVNTEQSRVPTEPSVISPALSSALTHGDAGAQILAAQVKVSNARKAEQRARLADELGPFPSC